MFHMMVVQAEHGDCFVLRFGKRSPRRHVIVDGGPARTYPNHLRPLLELVTKDRRHIDLAILSHVDNDHIVGFLDLLGELQHQRRAGERQVVRLKSMWHNSFEDSVGEPRFESAIRAVLPLMSGPIPESTSFGMVLRSIREGHDLHERAHDLEIPLNPEFPGGHVVLEDGETKQVQIDNLTLRLVGPSRGNLERLRRQWLKWLEEQRERVAKAQPLLPLEMDRSIPNLSSIVVLAEAEGRSLLLTGDGRGDHILEGLAEAGLLGPDDKLHVSVLKMPHHGSIRNVTPEFLRAVTADVYVISANGRHGNPDFETLEILVTVSQAEGRRIEIVLTNETESTDQLIGSYPPEQNGYNLTFLPANQSVLTLDIGGGRAGTRRHASSGARSSRRE